MKLRRHPNDAELRQPPGDYSRDAMYGGANPERLFVDKRGDGLFNVETWFPDVTHRLVLTRRELEGLATEISKALR